MLVSVSLPIAKQLLAVVSVLLPIAKRLFALVSVPLTLAKRLFALLLQVVAVASRVGYDSHASDCSESCKDKCEKRGANSGSLLS